jgi:hypothetical protein
MELGDPLSDEEVGFFVIWLGANKKNESFITADERLYNAVRKDLGWVKWLGDH